MANKLIRQRQVLQADGTIMTVAKNADDPSQTPVYTAKALEIFINKVWLLWDTRTPQFTFTLADSEHSREVLRAARRVTESMEKAEDDKRAYIQVAADDYAWLLKKIEEYGARTFLLHAMDLQDAAKDLIVEAKPQDGAKDAERILAESEGSKKG